MEEVFGDPPICLHQSVSCSLLSLNITNMYQKSFLFQISLKLTNQPQHIFYKWLLWCLFGKVFSKDFIWDLKVSLADIGTNCFYIEETDFMLWSRIHRTKFRRIDLKTYATTHALSFWVWHIGTVEFAYSQIGRKYLVPKVVTWITSPVDKDTTT